MSVNESVIASVRASVNVNVSECECECECECGCECEHLDDGLAPTRMTRATIGGGEGGTSGGGGQGGGQQGGHGRAGAAYARPDS